eukprot:6210712-Pleurochrysis_carterae.AAC.1
MRTPTLAHTLYSPAFCAFGVARNIPRTAGRRFGDPMRATPAALARFARCACARQRHDSGCCTPVPLPSGSCACSAGGSGPLPPQRTGAPVCGRALSLSLSLRPPPALRLWRWRCVSRLAYVLAASCTPRAARVERSVCAATPSSDGATDAVVPRGGGAGSDVVPSLVCRPRPRPGRC